MAGDAEGRQKEMRSVDVNGSENKFECEFCINGSFIFYIYEVLIFFWPHTNQTKDCKKITETTL